ncbi:MAG: c-type cytochrome [Gammaproteobacteria bacterium]|nr:c-type cytochrome [Gammaproteobacteria bacterium]
MRTLRSAAPAGLGLLGLTIAAAQAPPATVKTALYEVRDGTRVDARTFAGWRTWRALACDRCHGEAQQGLVGPSLLQALKVLTPLEFQRTVSEGRQEKGMPSFGTNPRLGNNWEGLYAYLKGRAEGDIAAGPLTSLGESPAP